MQLIVDVQDEVWSEIFDKAIYEEWKHFCVFPSGYPDKKIHTRVGNLNLGSSLVVHRGKIPSGMLLSLPKDLLCLVAVGQSLDESDARAIAENLTQLTTLDIGNNVIIAPQTLGQSQSTLNT